MFLFRSAKKEKTELAKFVKTKKDADEFRRKMQRSFVANQRPSIANCNIGQRSSFHRRYQDITSSPARPQNNHRSTSNLVSEPAKPRPSSYRPQPRKPVPSYGTNSQAHGKHESPDDTLISTAFRDADAQIVDDIMRLLRQPGSSSEGEYTFGYGSGYGYDKFMPQPPTRTATVIRIRPSHVEPPTPAALKAKSMVAELVENNPDPLFAPLDNKPSDACLRTTWKPADTVLAIKTDPKVDEPKQRRGNASREDEDRFLVPDPPMMSSLRRKDAQRLPAIPRRHKLLRNVVEQKDEPRLL